MLQTGRQSTSSPEVFGPAIWWTLHATASAYPDEPSASQRADCASLARALPSLLPCLSCGEHLREELSLRDLASACASGERLSAFWCDVHNSVNARLGKVGVDCSQVRERYAWVPAVAAESSCACAGPVKGAGGAL